MKALSVHRPWGYAYVALGKPLENRRRRDGTEPSIMRYRGPLLLHNARKWDDEAIGFMFERQLLKYANAVDGQRRKPKIDSLRPGGIFARGRAVGHVWAASHGAPTIELDDSAMVAADQGRFKDSLELRWWRGGYALIIVDVEAVLFVPCPGRPGIWDVPDDVAAKVSPWPS